VKLSQRSPTAAPDSQSHMPKLDVEVLPGPILNGVAPHIREPFSIYGENAGLQSVAEVLREVNADMLVNFLPVGSCQATRYYAQAALDVGCAFVNCIPEFIASDEQWAERFEKAGLPVAGDDVKSQLGATILHRTLVRLFAEKGVIVDETYQLNIGGNTDFQRMTSLFRRYLVGHFHLLEL